MFKLLVLLYINKIVLSNSVEDTEKTNIIFYSCYYFKKNKKMEKN